MRIMVLDTCNGDDVTHLYFADPAGRRIDRISLNYVPEVCYDAAQDQIVVVETELGGRERNRGSCNWLKLFNAADLTLLHQVETPARPMYTGFPNRSSRVAVTASGRYIYYQVQQVHPDRQDVYRIRPGRFDRHTGRIATGCSFVDSCVADFGLLGDDEHELFFHLSCDLPNTFAFGHFESPDLDILQVGGVTSRTYSLNETCGSWTDRSGRKIYCVTRQGLVFCIEGNPSTARQICRLPIKDPHTVPLQHIYGAGHNLFVGVARDANERSLSLASEIWVLSRSDGAVAKAVALREPVINFVVDEGGQYLYGISPYQRTLQIVDMKSGNLADMVSGIGITPCEVRLIP